VVGCNNLTLVNCGGVILWKQGEVERTSWGSQGNETELHPLEKLKRTQEGRRGKSNLKRKQAKHGNANDEQATKITSEQGH